jgi:beta-glucosidase
MKKRIVILLAACFGVSIANAQLLPYQDATLSAGQRADDLLSRLTLDEKVSLMMNNSPAIERLGVPQFQWWNEALHGIGRNGVATVFPITMAMAASWDDVLLHKVFTAVSDEARVKAQQAKRSGEIKRYQSLSFWTPNINIFRDPRWGRGQETYGEDPYLTSKMGLAVVRGLQGVGYNGEDLGISPYRKLLACAKHFAVHSGPEWNRHTFNIEELPERDLWETYLPAFKALVVQGKVAEVMCAYQRVYGEACCAHTRYEQQILRKEWGFDGLVTSDCGAIRDFLPERHNVARDGAEASAKAVLTGTDVECGSTYKNLPEAVRRGDISESALDTSLRRLLVARFELGDFDDDSLVAWTKIPEDVVACKEHKQLALDMARKSIVLLKNDDILPLRRGHDIVVVGANATDSVMMWGNYSGFPSHTVTAMEGIKRFAPNAKFIGGCGLTRNETTADSLLQKIGNTETVIFIGGISPKLEGEEMKVSEEGFKGGDRTSIELPQAQRDMLNALKRAGKNVVFVNCSGSAMALVPEQKSCAAIIQAWYGGEQGGEALAEVLFGQDNPSGKLPVTFYRSTDDLPDFLDYTMKNRTYRYFTGKALYPFGYGLSYTTFYISKPKYEDGNLQVSVKNTGKVSGTETLQVYVRNTSDKEGPLKTLRGYKQVTLTPGEQQTVSIDLPRESFEGWDSQTNTMRVVPGKYEVMVGNSSSDDSLKKIIVEIN